MRLNNDAKLQEALFNIGAYKGMKNRKGTELTYEQAVDGIFGDMSQQAIKNAEAMGYTIDRANGTVSKKKTNTTTSSTNKSKRPITTSGANFPSQVIEQAAEPTSNIYRNVLGKTINPFVSTSYMGSEDDARRLGYRTYGWTGRPVNYSVEPSDSTSQRSIASAQMQKYGITQEQAQDKSRVHNLLYEYMPTNGYDVFMMLEGMARGDKNADSKTGKAVRGNKKRPVSEAVEKAIGKVYDAVTNSTEGSEQARRAANYNRNATAKREDLRNLMMGFPIVNGTLEVTPFDEMGKGQFQDGYGFRFKDRTPLNEARNANLAPGEHRQIADGYDMGHHGISRSEDGNTRSYYDYWNINPLTLIPGVGSVIDKMIPQGLVGRGFDLYDRTTR